MNRFLKVLLLLLMTKRFFSFEKSIEKKNSIHLKKSFPNLLQQKTHSKDSIYSVLLFSNSLGVIKIRFDNSISILISILFFLFI